MRAAKISDGWRRVLEKKRYPVRLESVQLNGVLGFCGDFELRFYSGLSGICGKNGVGKSTLLNLIYQKIKFDDIDHFKCSSETDISVEIFNDNESGLDDKVFYLDPSAECNRIIDYIKETNNFIELLDGVESSYILDKKDVKKQLSKVVGKQYKSIKYYELDGALGDDITFPYFEVELMDGTKYTSSKMGLGEHLCFYLFWYVNWIEQNSLLLIEEIENYLSAYSQEGLIDYFAYRLSDRGVWAILTSHSEHILNRIGLDNISIIYSRNGDSKRIVSNKQRAYYKALGLGEKLIGAFLVEDHCASIFLKRLILKFFPSLLDDREIVSLRCDSNIEKMVKHFEPNEKIDYDFFAVFDADQSSKISKLNNKNLPATSLPSENSLNPEEELWSFANLNLRCLSEELHCNFDRLEEAFDENQTSDHHDRFHNISRSLKVSYESLVNSCIDVWVKEERNYNLSTFLILSLLIRGETKTVREINLNYSEIVSKNDFRLIDKKDELTGRFVFNGVGYSFIE